jgi:hypothetical protein
LRTGSIGNRDAETLVNTLPEPKKSILQAIRRELLSLGYSEEAGYDAINIESYVAYSAKGENRFFLKHKWEVVVVAVLDSDSERQKVLNKIPSLQKKEFEPTEDSTMALKLDPKEEKETIFELAKYFLL